MPSFTVIAGPNGSGKSTLTKWNRESLQDAVILDPDAIAKSLDPESGAAGGSAVDAGRAVLLMAANLLLERQSFAVETTLSGNTYLRMMRRAKAAGYQVTLLFIGTACVDINLQRVRMRVIKGGHSVPEEDQRRRYPRSLQHMRAALETADEAIVYDNSSSTGFVNVAVKAEGSIRFEEPLPVWAEFLRTS